MSLPHKISPRAWLYLRVSSDPTGRALSVASQEKELRAWGAVEGWEIVGVTIDNDLSASRHAKKDRPGYREVKRQMSSGAMDLLACWESSRAQRDLSAYVQMRELCSTHNVLWAYKGRVYDMSRTEDRFTTGLDALLDERYADETRDRVMRGVRTRLANGTPHGKIPFGYRREYDPRTGAVLRQVPDEESAPIVRELFERLGAGEAVYSIAKDFNTRGVPTPQLHRDNRLGVVGDRRGWTASKIRRQVSNPALAGYRVHQGKIVGEAAWKPLVDAELFTTVNQLLADPSRRTQRGVQPRHLLSGILECGVCGANCRRIQNRGRPSYCCHGRNFNNKACVCIRQEPVDALVEQAVVLRLSSPDALSLFNADENDLAAAASRELQQLEARLEEFRQSAESPDGISAATLARMEAKYEPLITEARRRATPAWVPPVVADLAYGDTESRWQELSLRAKREVIGSLMRVRLAKDTRPRGSRGYDLSRVEITWR